MTPPSLAALQQAIERKLRVTTASGLGSRPVGECPAEAAEAVMAVVAPVLEARDAEIARQARLLAAYVPTGERKGGSEGEGPYPCACRHEGWYDPKCACCNRRPGESGSEEGESRG